MTAHPLGLKGGWTCFPVADRDDGPANTVANDLIKVLDTVEVPIVVVHGDLTITGFNRAAADVLGLSFTDLCRSVRSIAVLAALPRLEQECREVMTGGVEARMDLRDGDRWFVVRLSPLTRGGHEITGAVLTFTNVTAFRASIDQAVYERECTKAILNTVADPLVVLSADQRIQSGNRAFHAMFDLSRDEIQGVSLFELADGALDIPSLRRHLGKIVDGGHALQPVEVDHVPTAEGPRTLVVDAGPLSFPGHSQRRVLLTFQDITARKQAQAAKDLRSEEELRRSEASLAEGQRLSLTGTFSWSAATGEVAGSEQLHRIYGLEVGAPVTFDAIRGRVHPADVGLLDKMVEQARDGMNDFEWQYRLLMPDGSIRYVQAVAHATRDQDGQLEYIAAVQDITTRRMAEEALAKARSELAKVARVSSLGVLTASIAHELNQPLSGIITNAGTCLRMLDATPPNLEGARETARRTIRDGNRASDVITRLRTLFSKGELTLEVLDLNEAMREVIALSLSDLQRTGVAVRWELADDLPIISGDRIQLQQVVLNLIRNASEAMADLRDRPRHLLIRTERDGDERVRVSIRDAGVGVDPENLTRLLDAFYTTKTDGMGIGLSVSRAIIERHQGRLWAEPNDGPGATFSFSIPVDPPHATDVTAMGWS
jgi:PAS domain S-box-containing protein